MKNKKNYIIACLTILCGIAIIFSCSGDDESPGDLHQTGTVTGTLTGTGTSTGATTGTSTGVSNQPPTGQIVSPANDDCVLITPIVITGTADDDNAISSIELKVDDVVITITGTNNWTGTSSTLTGGSHSIELTVYDNEGSNSTPNVINFKQETVGLEFQVNTYTTSSQTNPSVAIDDTGNFVITWESEDQDGDGRGIYAQRYDSSGNTIGSEFQVNTYTTNNQSFPSVTMNSIGNFVIIWNSIGQDGDNYGVYAQRYDSTGNIVGSEFRVNTYTIDAQSSPSAAIDGTGNSIITWHSNGQDGDSTGIYAQRYDSTGNTVGSEFRVNTYTTNAQFGPSVAIDGTGNFVVTWESIAQDGDNGGIYAQRYDSSGNTVGSEFRVNTYTTDDQKTSSVVMNSTGNFVITWQSRCQDGSPYAYGIYAQRYDSSGNTIGSEFQVNTYTANEQQSSSIAINGTSNFVITWQSELQDGDSYGVYAQRYLWCE